MRRTLFESLAKGPLTENAPRPQDSGLARQGWRGFFRQLRCRRRRVAGRAGRSAHYRLPAFAESVVARAARALGGELKIGNGLESSSENVRCQRWRESPRNG